MKVAILVAGANQGYFPFFIDKPKCLYSVDGEIQLEKILKKVRNVVKEKDIIIVAGYKASIIKKYLEEKKFSGKLKINKNYKKSAIYSLLTAIENEKEDILFIMGDENVSLNNIFRLSLTKKDMGILYDNNIMTDSLEIFKLKYNKFYLLKDKKYERTEFLEEVLKYYNIKEKIRINKSSGIGLGYMTADLIRVISEISNVENIMGSKNIEFVKYNRKLEYVKDLDLYYQTDEYKNSFIKKVYFLMTYFFVRIYHRLRY